MEISLANIKNPLKNNLQFNLVGKHDIQKKNQSYIMKDGRP